MLMDLLGIAGKGRIKDVSFISIDMSFHNLGKVFFFDPVKDLIYVVDLRCGQSFV